MDMILMFPEKKVKNTPMCQLAYRKLPTAARAVERLIFSNHQDQDHLKNSL